MSRARYYIAGMIAFLVGVPLTEEAFAASGSSLIGAAIDLGLAIAGSAGDS